MPPLLHLRPRLDVPAWQRFLLAGGLFLAAAAARFTVVPADLGLPYLAFYPGLALAIFLCGSGPALLFIVLSVLGGMIFDVYPLLASGGLFPAMAGATHFLVASVALLISVAFFQYHGMWWREGAASSPETVAQGESWLAGVVNSAMDAIVSVDERQRIVVFNPAAERMFGYPAAEVVGQGFERLIGEEGGAANVLWGDDFGKGELPRQSSGGLGLLSARRRDGSEFPIEASISQGVVNGVRIFTVIMRDISERTQVRQALAEQEERFRAFMTHSPLASWLVDGKGCFQYVNPVFYTMFGVGTDEVLGKCIGDIYPAELAAQQLHTNQVAIDSGQALEVIEPGVRADGSPGTFLVFKFSIRNAAGAALVCANALDITERQRIEALLVDTNKRLSMVAEEQADHLRALAAELTRVEQNERDELSEMLHDHVQPLLIAARLSLSGLNPEAPLVTWEKVVHEACGHISSAIDIARGLSVELNPPLVREKGLGAALEWQGRQMAAAHGISIGVFCDPAAEPEDAETRLLCFKGVRELLMNSIKHSGADRVEVDMMLDGEDTLRIAVTDYGKGFDPQALHQMAPASLGSGLAGIERRLGMIGGRLLIDSAPGAGCSMTLVVPLRKRQESERPQLPRQGGAGLTPPA